MVHATQGNLTMVKPDLREMAVTVIGMGKSGLAATRLLQAVGARVTIADEKDELTLAEQSRHVDQKNLRICVGKQFESAFEEVDLIVVSPGIPTDHPHLEVARHQGLRIIGEIELASWFLNVPLIAVTGTNGKSTTVRLIGQIFEESGKRSFVGGNLGVPLSEAALNSYQSARDPNGGMGLYDYLIAEVSSFQLETTEQFRPWIAAVLNITPDHLDRYHSLAEYQQAKRKIFENQTSEDFSLVNLDDPTVVAMTDDTSASVVGFSLCKVLEQGVYLEGTIIKSRIRGVEYTVLDRERIRLRGHHNLANVLAAVAVGLLSGCPVDVIRHVVSTFSGIEHAIEFVREHHGVLFYNDSKGTNVGATLKALESFDEPILLILGGKDKGGDFTRLREPIRQKVKQVIAMGESTLQLVEVLKGVKPISIAESLSEAVHLAVNQAESGEIVLLSPACASFDMFRNYEERGQEFKRLVNALT